MGAGLVYHFLFCIVMLCLGDPTASTNPSFRRRLMNTQRPPTVSSVLSRYDRSGARCSVCRSFLGSMMVECQASSMTIHEVANGGARG